MNKKKKVLTVLFMALLISASFALIFAGKADAAVDTTKPVWDGIVPCGRNIGSAEETIPCTLCHLIIGFQRLTQYALYLVTTLALVAVFFAGVMYIVSSGDEGMMTKAKGFLKTALIGFAVVIGGWLIVNVTINVIGAKSDLGVDAVAWNKFTCSTKSSAGTGKPNPPPPPPGSNDIDWYTSSTCISSTGDINITEGATAGCIITFYDNNNLNSSAYSCSIDPASKIQPQITGSGISNACFLTSGSAKPGSYNLNLTITTQGGKAETKSIPVKVTGVD